MSGMDSSTGAGGADRGPNRDLVRGNEQHPADKAWRRMSEDEQDEVLDRDAESYQKHRDPSLGPRPDRAGWRDKYDKPDLVLDDLTSEDLAKVRSYATMTGVPVEQALDLSNKRAAADRRSSSRTSDEDQAEAIRTKPSSGYEPVEVIDHTSLDAPDIDGGAEATDGTGGSSTEDSWADNVNRMTGAAQRRDLFAAFVANPPDGTPQSVIDMVKADITKMDRIFGEAKSRLGASDPVDEVSEQTRPTGRLEINEPDRGEPEGMERRDSGLLVPVEGGGRTDVSSPEYAAWYRAQDDTGDAPAPRATDATITEIPDYERRPGGTFGRLTDVEGNVLAEFRSGRAGPGASDVIKVYPTYNAHLRTHVEAHGAAWMRQNGVGEAVLYINREMCPFDKPADHPTRQPGWDQGTCSAQLPGWLPDNGKITVYDPEGWHVRRGRTEDHD